MKVYHQHFVLLIVLILCWSCGKGNMPQSGKTIVSFNIPPIERDAMDKDIHSWGATTPSTSSDVDCVGIFVYYPENDSSSGRCSDSTGNALAKASSLLGLYNRGASVSAAITSGSNRTFYLIGFASNGTCPNFSNIGPTEEVLLSEPILLGSTSTSIAGTAQSVSLSGSVSSAQTLSDCSGGPFNWAEGTGLYGTGADGSVSAGSYASLVTNAKVKDLSSDGKTVTVDSATNFSVGKEIFWHVVGTGLGGTGCDTTGGTRSAGLTGTATVTAQGATTFTIDTPLGGPGSSGLSTNLYNGWSVSTANNATVWCKIQVMTMPNFQDFTIDGTSSITASASSIESGGTSYGGGIVAFRVNGTLTLSSTATAAIDAVDKGYQTTTDTVGHPGASAYGIGGSATYTNNGSGGGGGHTSSGGAGGGASYASVGESITSYGSGGSYMSCTSTTYGRCMQFGGEGGNGSATGSGNGGGIIYIYARNIVVSGTVTIAADGSSASGGGGGGGGGGTVVIATNSLTIPTGSTLNVNSIGGNRHGGGGAGGGGLINIYSCSQTGAGTLSTSVLGGNSSTTYAGYASALTTTCP